MEALAPFHPQIVHFPVALLIASALFALIGRATDIDWWRRAGTALLVLGFLGAAAAYFSGDPAGERAEERQGVPEAAVDAHERMAVVTLALAGAAVVALAVATRARGAAPLLTALALLLQLGAAITVGIAGHRGGMLVREHGAGVRVGGALVGHPGPAEPSSGEHEEHEER